MPGKNYHDSQTVNYVCPFFKSERENFICCEGVAPYTSNKTCFTKKAALMRYRNRYCFDFTYKSCHWAQVLMQKKYKAM